MLFGEAEHARWTQEIPTPPLCYLDKEAVNMFSSNVQKIGMPIPSRYAVNGLRRSLSVDTVLGGLRFS